MRLKQHSFLISIVTCLISLGSFSGCNRTPNPAGAQRYYGEKRQLEYETRLGELMFQHYCAVCHGLTGEGDGFNAFNLTPRPRDLSDSSFQASLTDGQLAEIIQNGGQFRGKSRHMPAWGETLDSLKVNDVVKFVRTLVEVNAPISSSEKIK